MTFHEGHIEFSDGRKLTNKWVNKDDAINYYEYAPYYKDCVRAECFEYTTDEANFGFIETCIYEYDIDGKYFYNVA